MEAISVENEEGFSGEWREFQWRMEGISVENGGNFSGENFIGRDKHHREFQWRVEL